MGTPNGPAREESSHTTCPCAPCSSPSLRPQHLDQILGGFRSRPPCFAFVHSATRLLVAAFPLHPPIVEGADDLLVDRSDSGRARYPLHQQLFWRACSLYKLDVMYVFPIGTASSSFKRACKNSKSYIPVDHSEVYTGAMGRIRLELELAIVRLELRARLMFLLDSRCTRSAYGLRACAGACAAMCCAAYACGRGDGCAGACMLYACMVNVARDGPGSELHCRSHKTSKFCRCSWRMQDRYPELELSET